MGQGAGGGHTSTLLRKQDWSSSPYRPLRRPGEGSCRSSRGNGFKALPVAGRQEGFGEASAWGVGHGGAGDSVEADKDTIAMNSRRGRFSCPFVSPTCPAHPTVTPKSIREEQDVVTSHTDAGKDPEHSMEGPRTQHPAGVVCGHHTEPATPATAPGGHHRDPATPATHRSICHSSDLP